MKIINNVSPYMTCLLYENNVIILQFYIVNKLTTPVV